MKEFLKFAPWSSSTEGGVYNVMASFSNSFMSALSKQVSVVSGEDIVKGIPINGVIGFNASGYNGWKNILDSHVRNIVWTVDSVFYQNFYLYDEFHNNDNFVLLNVVPSDSIAVKHYMPDFKHCFYFPHAVDMNLWNYENVKKENDVVFFGSIIDIDKRRAILEEKYPADLLAIIKDMIALSLANPSHSFWNIYTAAKNAYGLELEKGAYHEIFQDMADICEAEQRIRMVRALEKFNLKVYGNGPWNKYISGNVSYCGSCDIKESIDIMNKSKVSLHIQPMKLAGGLHERILNAAAVKTFNLVADNPNLKNTFGNSFGYFNSADFNDIADVLSDYLRNDSQLADKTESAYTIVKNNHTWDNRVDEFVKLFI